MAGKSKKPSVWAKRARAAGAKAPAAAGPVAELGLTAGGARAKRGAMPKSFPALSRLRDALVAEGRLAEAVAPALRAAAMAPGDARALLALGEVYLRLRMPIHGARTFRAYIHAFGEDAPIPLREIIAAAEQPVIDDAEQRGVDRAVFEEAVFRMFEGWLALQLEDPAGAIAASDSALELVPDLVPALNNRAAGLMATGRLQEAIAASRRVVEEIDPANAFALATLVQAFLFSGDRKAAERLREPLRALIGRAALHPQQVGRGLAWLDDDEGVYRSFAGQQGQDSVDARLLATAATNLEMRQEALRCWRAYLRLVPEDKRAQGALADLQAGRSRRMTYYLVHEVAPRKVLREFADLAALREKGDAAAAARLDQLVERNPQLTFAAETALRDPATCDLGRVMLEALGTPAAVDALRRFVTGKEGSMGSPTAAAHSLYRMGALDGTETLPFWDGGEWRQVSFGVMDLTADGDPLPGPAQETYARAIDLLQERRAAEALPLLRQLTRDYPDEPCFHNDLGAAHEYLGRSVEGIAARMRAIELDASYVPARTFLAHRCLDGGDVDGARGWIGPLLGVRRMHPRHYAALMLVQGRLALAMGEVDIARSHLETIRKLGPTEEMAALLESLIAAHRAGRARSARR